MIYFCYLDEFGHIGPFLSRTDPRHSTSPVFGLGGLVLPALQVRNFATFFYRLKCNLLTEEIQSRGEHPAKWEKKGTSLYTRKNIETYYSLRQATFRILNRIRAMGGFVFYTGIEKDPPTPRHTPEALYLSVLKDAIRKLTTFCIRQSAEAHFCMVLDKPDDRDNNFRPKSVQEAGRVMFGEGQARLLEPPFQVESHLYQTMQCADWMCALVGKIQAFACQPEFVEYEPHHRFFAQRLASAQRFSTLRRKGIPHTEDSSDDGSEEDGEE